MSAQRMLVMVVLVAGVLVLLMQARHMEPSEGGSLQQNAEKTPQKTPAGNRTSESKEVRAWDPNERVKPENDGESRRRKSQLETISPLANTQENLERKDLSPQLFDRSTIQSDAENLPAGEAEFNRLEQKESVADREPKGNEAKENTFDSERQLEVLFHKLKPEPSPTQINREEVATIQEGEPSVGEGLQGSSRRVGVRSVSRSDFLEVDTPQKEASEDGDSDASEEILLTDPSGHARGYSMLYAMQPEARSVVEAELEILLASAIRKVHIGILADGTFGWDPQYVKSLVSRIAESGRDLSLTLYVSNGSTQRVLEGSAITESFPQLSPEEFREAIRFDPVVRSQFSTLVRRVIPIFIFNRSMNSSAQNYIVPMLEDNLDTAAFQSMKEITEQEIGDLAVIVRNPCIGCYSGNDFTRFGLPLELHGMENINLLRPGDTFSLDGTGYRIENDPSALPHAISEGAMREVLRLGQRLPLRYVGLWRSDRQGIFSRTTGEPPKPPRERTYVPPTDVLKEIERGFLRYGLE